MSLTHNQEMASLVARPGGGGSPVAEKNKWGTDTMDAAAVAWSSNIVTTDLALATPSPH